MRHSTKMLLIPEDVYNALMSAKKGTEIKHSPATDIAVEQSQQRLHKISGNRRENADARNIKYNQEYKRYKKFVKDREDRPLSVKVENLNNAVQRSSTTSSSSSSTDANLQFPDNNVVVDTLNEGIIIPQASGVSNTPEKQVSKLRPSRTAKERKKTQYLPYYFPDKYNKKMVNNDTTTLKKQKGSGLKRYKLKISLPKIKSTSKVIKKTTFKPQLWSCI